MGSALQKSLGLHAVMLILLWLLYPGASSIAEPPEELLVVRPVAISSPPKPPPLPAPAPLEPLVSPAGRPRQDQPRPEPEKPAKKVPQLALKGPAYPVHHSKLEAVRPDQGRPPQPRIPNDGHNAAAGEQGDDAYPIYHPPVEIFHQGTMAAHYLEAEFRLQANGNFRVRLLTSLGSAKWDGIALATLERWRWQPRRVEGKPVASTEVIRLTTQSP
ncbi:MAG: energy transducer TonB [Vulcanimicrobiota bacterium]